MTEHQHTPWPKTSRRFGQLITITEKIDGTNSAIGVNETSDEVWAQSRKRIITPDSDNFGFARWVHDNAGVLADILGPGLHFGEWWGQGIQRSYGLREKRFSLFNTRRWLREFEVLGPDWQLQDQLYLVPVLAANIHNSDAVVLEQLTRLHLNGSLAVPGFPRPEGVCVYGHDSGIVEKAFEAHRGLELDWTQKGV